MQSICAITSPSGKTIGIDDFRQTLLDAYPLPSSTLESAESLEQLRFLEAGYHIHTIETDYELLGIDTPADLEQARNRVRRAEATLEDA